MPDTAPRPKREKRQVSLEGQDPIEVLKRLLQSPPERPAKSEKPQSNPG
jgi:hypothetical protein